MKLDPAQLEIVSIDGELAIIVRMGRAVRDGIPEFEAAKRASRLTGAATCDDPLRLFLPNVCEIKTGQRVRAGELIKVYKAWAKETGARALTVVKFNEAMIYRGFEQIKSNGTWWLDLRIRGQWSDDQRRHLRPDWAGSSLGAWAEVCCDTSDPCAREQATPLYLAFRQFCIDRGECEEGLITQTMFGLRLSDAGVYAVPNHASGKMERVGIRLLSLAETGVPRV